jgi:DNA-binding winged helix-turn-helix (wHTH) protein
VGHFPAIAQDDQAVRFGRREIHLTRRNLLVDGVSRPLQPRPFDLLAYLIQHRDRVVTRGELLAEVWNDAPVQPCSLPAAVLRLRKALVDGNQSIVRTYQRVGYRFVAPLDPAVRLTGNADGLRVAGSGTAYVGMQEPGRPPVQAATIA